jgi:flavin-dependent dehydrogenase
MSRSPDYDAIVVGARVAGSVTAALLGDRGHRVLLVDAAHFPSTTVSTHYFRGGAKSRGAVSVLQDLGVLDDVLSLRPPRLRWLHWYLEGEPRRTLPEEEGLGSLAVRRAPLDHILVRRARRSPSVDVWEGARVVGLHRQGGRVDGVRVRAADGTSEPTARIVVGADGRHSVVARDVAAPVLESEPGHRGYYYQYFAGIPGPRGEPDGAEFSTRGDELGYIFPSDGGLSCVALSLNLEDYAWVRQDPKARSAERFRAHRPFAERLEQGRPEGKLVGFGPEPNVVRQPFGPGWALVGDAGLHQDPWTGYGIDCAAIHGAYLSDALSSWFSGRLAEAPALQEFAVRRETHVMGTYRFTVGGSRDIRRVVAEARSGWAAAPPAPASV